jgi:hypothetical protein
VGATRKEPTLDALEFVRNAKLKKKAAPKRNGLFVFTPVAKALSSHAKQS